MSLKEEHPNDGLAALEAMIRQAPGGNAMADAAIFDAKHPVWAKFKGYVIKLKQVCFWLLVMAAFDVVFALVISGGKLPYLS
jgi:hypothetical protein